MDHATELFTAGYAGCDPRSFLAKIRRHEVEVVVDVRQNPVSRKKGFSRAALASFLSAHAVEYVHEPELGVPAELRARLRSGEQDLAAYLASFRQHLDGHEVALGRVYARALAKRCCLVCLESRSEECHRSVVADTLVSRNGGRLRVVHL